MKNSIVKLTLSLCLLAGAVQAQVPGIISHQGRLTVSGTNFTGNASFKFALVATNSLGVYRSLWSHDGSSIAGGEPSGTALSLPVAKGVYSVNLGDVATANMVQEIPASIFTNRVVLLRTWVNDGTIGFQQLLPDRRITAVAYALSATYVLEPATSATNFLGSLAGDVTGAQGATVVGLIGGVAASNVASGAILANAATNANTPGALVKRDASGNFAAGTVSGNFVGNGAGLTNLLATAIIGTAPGATNFTAPLVGDVTGSQAATVVATVGGMTAANVANGATLANAATNGNTPGTLVRRDANGNFAAGTVSGLFVGGGAGLTNLLATAVIGTAPSATNFTAPLIGDVTGSQGATVVRAVAGMTATNVAFGAAEAIAATPTNELGVIVRRDPCDSSFAAGTISARFIGDGSGLTNLPTSPPYFGPPSGSVLVSLFSPDPVLFAAGYRQFMSTTVPSWVNGSSTNAPTARSGLTAVWSGSAMIVWGGTAGGTSYIGSGGSYDPATDVWTSLSAVGIPAARIGHTAVWTDTQMIVWGGKGTSGYLATGSRFTPSISGGSWSATVATLASGVPAARMGHVAVWTGSKMIIWGGINLAGLLNDGAMYDPVLNQWTAINLPDAPEVRMNATAVWATDRMVVWGGMGEAGELNSGGQLIFSNGVPNRWQATTNSNAPYPRIGHTATWTGSKMIIWGGQSGSIPLGDGAVYSTTADQWTTVSSTNAPAARFDHSAVWTGTELLIAAGANVSGAINSSAGYDPSTQQWRPLSSLGSPAARSQLGAAWSGTELLLFGGTSGTQTMTALQRIAPQPAWYFYRKL